MQAVLKNDQYLRLYESESLGVGAIDNPDQFEQVFDTYYIPETSEKFHGRHFDGPSLENVTFCKL